jgi:hypothetical protein
MKFKEVLLLILLIIAGLVIYQIQTGHWDLQIDWDDDFIRLGREYTYEVTEVFESPFPARLEIANSHGWVVVEGTDEEVARLTFKKKIWRKDEASAREIADRLTYNVERTGDFLYLSTNRAEFRKRNFETGFILSVPRGTAVLVENSYGYVNVSDVREALVKNRHGKVSLARVEGDCTIENSYEDVVIENAGGFCDITTKHADIQVYSISDGLRIENRYGNIRLEDVGQSAEIYAEHCEIRGRRIQGDLDLETSYERIDLVDVGPARIRARHSPVDVDEVRGNLDIQTSYEAVRATNVHGNLSVTGRTVGVTAWNIGGDDIVIDTSYRKVNLSEFEASTRIALRNGDLILKPKALRFPINVQSEYADIHFFWPDGEEAPFEARSKGGNIHWGLGETPDVSQANGISLVKAFQERTDRGQIILTTTYSDITIEEYSPDF